MTLMRNGPACWVSGGALLVLSACHEMIPPPVSGAIPVDRTPRAASSDAELGTAQAGAPSPEPIRIAPDADESNRWLFVEQAMADAEGAWATGSFEPRRNKIGVRTRAVRRFAINVRRIPIDWERVVILGIDGRNSELRRRDYSVYHFSRDDHGRWVVLEP